MHCAQGCHNRRKHGDCSGKCSDHRYPTELLGRGCSRGRETPVSRNLIQPTQPIVETSGSGMEQTLGSGPLNAEASPDGLGKRYAFKLGSSILSWPLNLGTQLMLTRALGPSEFGSFSYLTSFFANVIGFFDSGSSIGFYTKLCSRPKDGGLKIFYWCFAVGLGAVTVFLVFALLAVGWHKQLWPGQPSSWIYWALTFALFTWYIGIGEKIVDAHALTARGEPLRLFVKLLGFVALGWLFAISKLGLVTYLACQISLVLFQYVLWERMLRRNGESFYPRNSFLRQGAAFYSNELWAYSHPLVVYSLVSMGGALVDRWLLQYYAGGEQQGFYGLSYQVGAFCFLFTSAMVPLLAREFAEAHGTGDIKRMSKAFRDNLPRFYSLAAFGAVFMSLQADRISLLVGGEKFAQAAWPMALMCLYPIHQTYGQLSGSVFYATGQTRLYRNIGILSTILGMILSGLFLLPTGLGLGSTGLAYKMLLTQLFAINIQLWFNCRFLGQSFSWFLAHQIIVLMVLAVIAFSARAVSTWTSNPISGLIISATCYCVLVGIICWLFPRLFGLSKADLIAAMGKGKLLISSLNNR